jgi:hypothetical protein
MARGAGVVLATLASLAFAGPTAAATPKKICNATPQTIYGDLADNGVLDKRYCAADINRALRSPSLRPYDLPTPPEPKHSSQVTPATATNTRGSLPFSGLDLALFGGVGGPLLLIGASLGRVARVRAAEELGQ